MFNIWRLVSAFSLLTVSSAVRAGRGLFTTLFPGAIRFAVIAASVVILLISNLTPFYAAATMFSFLLCNMWFYFSRIYDFSNYTSETQRFWKRAYSIFWLVELYLFCILVYLFLIAPAESSQYIQPKNSSPFSSLCSPVSPTYWACLMVVSALLYNCLLVKKISRKYLILLSSLTAVAYLPIIWSELQEAHTATTTILTQTFSLQNNTVVSILNNNHLPVNSTTEVLLAQSNHSSAPQQVLSTRLASTFDYTRAASADSYVKLVIIVKALHVLVIYVMFLGFWSKLLTSKKVGFDLVSSVIQNNAMLYLFVLANLVIQYSPAAHSLLSFLRTYPLTSSTSVNVGRIVVEAAGTVYVPLCGGVIDSVGTLSTFSAVDSWGLSEYYSKTAASVTTTNNPEATTFFTRPIPTNLNKTALSEIPVTKDTFMHSVVNSNLYWEASVRHTALLFVLAFAVFRTRNDLWTVTRLRLVSLLAAIVVYCVIFPLKAPELFHPLITTSCRLALAAWGLITFALKHVILPLINLPALLDYLNLLKASKALSDALEAHNHVWLERILKPTAACAYNIIRMVLPIIEQLLLIFYDATRTFFILLPSYFVVFTYYVYVLPFYVWFSKWFIFYCMLPYNIARTMYYLWCEMYWPSVSPYLYDLAYGLVVIVCFIPWCVMYYYCESPRAQRWVQNWSFFWWIVEQLKGTTPWPVVYLFFLISLSLIVSALSFIVKGLWYDKKRLTNYLFKWRAHDAAAVSWSVAITKIVTDIAKIAIPDLTLKFLRSSAGTMVIVMVIVPYWKTTEFVTKVVAAYKGVKLWWFKLFTAVKTSFAFIIDVISSVTLAVYEAMSFLLSSIVSICFYPLKFTVSFCYEVAVDLIPQNFQIAFHAQFSEIMEELRCPFWWFIVSIVILTVYYNQTKRIVGFVLKKIKESEVLSQPCRETIASLYLYLRAVTKVVIKDWSGRLKSEIRDYENAYEVGVKSSKAFKLVLMTVVSYLTLVRGYIAKSEKLYLLVFIPQAVVDLLRFIITLIAEYVYFKLISFYTAERKKKPALKPTSYYKAARLLNSLIRSLYSRSRIWWNLKRAEYNNNIRLVLAWIVKYSVARLFFLRYYPSALRFLRFAAIKIWEAFLGLFKPFTLILSLSLRFLKHCFGPYFQEVWGDFEKRLSEKKPFKITVFLTTLWDIFLWVYNNTVIRCYKILEKKVLIERRLMRRALRKKRKVVDSWHKSAGTNKRIK